MVKVEIVYEGDLHCRLTHGPSGDEIQTDAPVDNMGKGEAFSPTDLMASSLGACMMTVMGIMAKRQGLDLAGSKVEVIKEMVSAPVRRIGKITVNFQMAKGIPQDKREILERAAHACPVHKSLHPDVETPITFSYPD
jgi:putative redox protein